ncbi:hypothetical protein SKDZ_10G1515 [Saccharomyces kudriavzevii ZP591]|nr:hypothetical protein SKDZ_10G1515 [Saccharomyces kudriavzevii ZP591]
MATIIKNTGGNGRHISIITKNDISSSLVFRFTTKVTRLLFILKMFQHTFLPFGLFVEDYNANWIVGYSAIVSIWGFAVWMERAYRNKMNQLLSQCTKIKCSRCDTCKKHPELFKCKYGMYFFLLYVSLTFSNILIQFILIKGSLRKRGIFYKIVSYVAVMPFQITSMIIHLMTAYLFKVYYLHNGHSKTDCHYVAYVKKPATEKKVISRQSTLI